jgi:hypothetical protein
MIGPLLRVAATAASARALRVAAHDAALRAIMTLGAAIAVAGGVFCLTCSAFILLERQFDAASAWAIVGAVWGVGGLFYFAAARRRR